MKLAREWVEIPAAGASFGAYGVAPEPAGEALPAVVLIQEIWGVDEHIQDLAGRLASAGYLVLAPDLYSLGGGRPADVGHPIGRDHALQGAGADE